MAQAKRDPTKPPTTPRIREALLSWLNNPCTVQELAKRQQYSQPALVVYMREYIPNWKLILAMHNAGEPVPMRLYPVWVKPE